MRSQQISVGIPYNNYITYHFAEIDINTNVLEARRILYLYRLLFSQWPFKNIYVPILILMQCTCR